MFTLNLKIDTANLIRAHQGLTDAEVHKSINRAINYALRRTRTVMKKEVTTDYNLKQSFVDNDTLKPKFSGSAKMSGEIMANIKPESMAHFNPQQYRDVFGNKRGGGHIRTSKRGAGFVSRKSNKNTNKSGVYVEIVRGRKEHLPGAWLYFRGTNPIVMARGKYSGPAGFIFANKSKGPRYPINKINAKSVYWGVLHPKETYKWSPLTEKWYLDELERQLGGAIKF